MRLCNCSLFDVLPIIRLVSPKVDSIVIICGECCDLFGYLSIAARTDLVTEINTRLFHLSRDNYFTVLFGNYHMC